MAADYRLLDEVVQQLVRAKDRGVKCNLLMGAGCSVTAGIPDATGMLAVIKEKYEFEYEQATSKTYNDCMDRLTPTERRDLISSLVSEAQLNMTHIAIAQLVANGYIHRVLTPNFDNLLIRALSLTQQYHPVYDLGSLTGEFNLEYIPEKAVFYLHGQYTGFRLMNTAEEIASQAAKVAPLFNKVRNGVWLVVGYSGTNDALVQLLEQVELFQGRLFWVGYMDEPAPKRIQSLLDPQKYAFYVPGFDSDGFFWELASRLNVFPPPLMSTPFTYLKDTLTQIRPYEASYKPLAERKFEKHTVDIIDNAIKAYERGMPLYEYHLKIGLYETIMRNEKELLAKKRNDLVARAYAEAGYRTTVEAWRRDSVKDANQAIELYEKARDYGGDWAFSDNNVGVCWAVKFRASDRTDREAVFTALECYGRGINSLDQDETPIRNWLQNIKTVTLFVTTSRTRLGKVVEGAKALNVSKLDFAAIVSWLERVTDEIDRALQGNEDPGLMHLGAVVEEAKVRFEKLVAQAAAAAGSGS